MPEYSTVNEFMVEELGMNPPLDPTVGIPTPYPQMMAPGIAISMLPSAMPFGVGFPPPPFGPGVGPPLTPLGLAYLGFGLIKKHSVYRRYPTEAQAASDPIADPCGDKTSFEQKQNIEADDD